MRYLLFLFIMFHGFSQKTDKVKLKIIVTNIKTYKGNIEMGVFNNTKSFLVKGKEYKTFSKNVTNDSIVFVLKDLTKGNYAISVYHDINSDKKCNLNFIGMPIEPYGFSQNFKPRFSKPIFNDCKIKMNGDRTIIINLID